MRNALGQDGFGTVVTAKASIPPPVRRLSLNGAPTYVGRRRESGLTGIRSRRAPRFFRRDTQWLTIKLLGLRLGRFTVRWRTDGHRELADPQSFWISNRKRMDINQTADLEGRSKRSK
jgi:hypothetical protein